jgi:hypothetical protein
MRRRILVLTAAETNREAHRRLRGNVDTPKTNASKAPVAMSQVLAAYLLAWRKESMYGKDTDWIFASNRKKGKTPRVGNMLVRSYLYPAAVKAGVFTTTNIKVMRMNKKKGKRSRLKYRSTSTRRASE